MIRKKSNKEEPENLKEIMESAFFCLFFPVFFVLYVEIRKKRKFFAQNLEKKDVMRYHTVRAG